MSSSKIYYDLHSLANILHSHKRQLAEAYGFSSDYKIVCTSIPGDPIHVGHLSILRESARLGHTLVVLVNTDRFLLEKKGYVFMPLPERLELFAGFEAVDFVVPWDDGSQFVDGALRILKPDIFTKGGDRSSLDAVAEKEKFVCDELNIQLILGVGGKEKVQSSSKLIEDVVEKINFLKGR